MSLVAANKTETNTYSVELSITAEAFKSAVEQAYLKSRKNIAIPGFRKGKAPRAMIEKLYGKEVFFEDALDIILPAEIEAAYKEADIKPVDQPKDFDVKSMSTEEGASITFNVTVKPEITVSQYKGIEAVKESAQVTDAEVDEEVNRMLDRNARLVDASDRAVENGDTTVIDFEGFVDGVAFDGGKAEKYNLVIGSGSFIPGFEEQIIGHNIGDEFDVNVTFPEAYAENLAGKAAVFKIKLHEIKVKEVPELDDEFAKDQGDYETVDEMKKGVREDLEKGKEASSKNNFENAVIEKLCENVEGEIPEIMFENKTNDAVKGYENRLSQQGINLDTYLMYMGLTMDKFREDLKVGSTKDVKLDLATEKIAELENITCSDEDYEAEIKSMSEAYSMDVEEIKAVVAEDLVRSEIVRRNTIKFVIDNAVATEPVKE